MKKDVIDSDEMLDDFLAMEQNEITKRVRWAEKRSRIEAIVWAILSIGSIVCVWLGLSDISFALSMIGLVVLAILTSELGFLSGYASGRYDMSITNLRVSLKKGDKEND